MPTFLLFGSLEKNLLECLLILSELYDTRSNMNLDGNGDQSEG